MTLIDFHIDIGRGLEWVFQTSLIKPFASKKKVGFYIVKLAYTKDKLKQEDYLHLHQVIAFTKSTGGGFLSHLPESSEA